MQDKNTISLIPDSISYAAVQEFLAQRLEANRASIRIQNRVQVVADEIWSNIVRYSGAAQASLLGRDWETAGRQLWDARDLVPKDQRRALAAAIDDLRGIARIQ